MIATIRTMTATKPCRCSDCAANPTAEQAAWAAWVETVFWPVAMCLKHGAQFFPDLVGMPEYRGLFEDRSHKPGDLMHAMREQIWVEYDIPAKHKLLWPERSKP